MSVWKGKPLAKTNVAGIAVAEVLIVAAIIGLLAAIALPAWQDFVTVSNRAEAKQALWEIAKLQEKRYSTKGSYASELSESPDAINYPMRTQNWYSLAIAGGGNEYTITATATGTQGQKDKGCVTLSLTNWGVSTPSHCWTE